MAMNEAYSLSVSSVAPVLDRSVVEGSDGDT